VKSASISFRVSPSGVICGEEMRLIPFSDLKPKKDIPYCRDHLRRLSKADLFPKPVALSNRRIAFVEEEIDAWVAAKIAARDDDRAIE
jgi:prophage regulatory protein